MDIAEAITNAYVETSSDCDSDDDDEQPPPKRSKVIVPLPTTKTRKHHSLHMPAVGESQNRCRRPGCTLKSTFLYMKCKVYLCLNKKRNYFHQFHVYYFFVIAVGRRFDLFFHIAFKINCCNT